MVGLQAAALSLPSGQSYRRPQSATFQPLPALSWQHPEGVGPTQPQCPPSLIPHRAAGHDASQDLGVPGIWGAHLEARLASSLVLQATAWHGLDLLCLPPKVRPQVATWSWHLLLGENRVCADGGDGLLSGCLEGGAEPLRKAERVDRPETPVGRSALLTTAAQAQGYITLPPLKPGAGPWSLLSATSGQV